MPILQTITVGNDINVLEKDKYGLRVVILNEENLQDYATDDGVIVGTNMKKRTQIETSVLELQAKSDSFASQIASLQAQKDTLDILLAEAKVKVDEIIALRTNV